MREAGRDRTRQTDWVVTGAGGGRSGSYHDYCSRVRVRRSAQLGAGSTAETLAKRADAGSKDAVQSRGGEEVG